MRTCGASSLGDCDGGISGEHIVSACAFDGPEIRVHGAPWTSDGEGERTIPLRRFVANIPCRGHDERLSPVDDAGARALEAIEEFERLGRVRQAMNRRVWNTRRMVVNGHDLERWLVKCAINFSCVTGTSRRWHATRTPNTKPPRCLVDHAFRLESLAEPMGLYVAARPGQTLHRNDGFETCRLFDEQGELMAWRRAGSPRLVQALYHRTRPYLVGSVSTEPDSPAPRSGSVLRPAAATGGGPACIRSLPLTLQQAHRHAANARMRGNPEGGIPRSRARDSRHSFATHSLEGGVEPFLANGGAAAMPESNDVASARPPCPRRRVLRRVAATMAVLLAAAAATAAVLASPGCADVVRFEGKAPGRAALPLDGLYRLTLHIRDVGSVSCKIAAEPSVGGFRANSRPGALGDVAGSWSALLAGVFARKQFPGGALISWRTPAAPGGGPARGVLSTPIRGFRSLVAAVDAPVELRDGNDHLAGFATVEPWRERPGDGHGKLADRIDSSLRTRLFDPPAADLPGVRAFVARLRAAALTTQDDVEFLLAAFQARDGVEFSHVGLLRQLDPRFDERLAAPAVPAVELTTDGDVATLRARHLASVGAEIDHAFERLALSGAKALVIDLRGNPGGDVSSLRVAAHLVARPAEAGVLFDHAARADVLAGRLAAYPRAASVASVEDLARRIDASHALVAYVEPALPRFDSPVAVLIDRNTASAAEPLAHLLRTSGRARLFGAPTAGKMLSSARVDVGDGWVLMLPAYDYLAADGVRLEGRGVGPDVAVPPEHADAAARAWLRLEIAR